MNIEDKAVLIKYHWKPEQDVVNFDRQEATRIAGKDPDYHVRDIWHAIERGETVEYELFVQMMEISEEQSQSFDPLDPTKTCLGQVLVDNGQDGAGQKSGRLFHTGGACSLLPGQFCPLALSFPRIYCCKEGLFPM